LHVFWEDLAELKCLAVSETDHGRGVGRELVEACWGAARDLEIKTVFTLTYVPGFFEKCGYHTIEKAELPHKIWNECVRCPLFPSCTEVALIRSVAPEPVAAGVNGAVATIEV
jgi:amino-acid N-acetyltransferase